MCHIATLLRRDGGVRRPPAGRGRGRESRRATRGYSKVIFAARSSGGKAGGKDAGGGKVGGSNAGGGKAAGGGKDAGGGIAGGKAVGKDAGGGKAGGNDAGGGKAWRQSLVAWPEFPGDN
eukprot:gene12450-biopygen567